MIPLGFEFIDGTGNEGRRLPEYAQAVEELGYESVWIPEGLGGGMDVLTAVSAALAVTKNVKIATNVLVVPYYHPWHLAKRVLTMDHMSKGRFMLGVGVGWRPPEFEIMGEPYTERGKLTDEALEIMIRLWEEGDIDFEGKYFRIKGLVTKLDPPYTKPHPRVLIGGGPSKPNKNKPQWPGTKMMNMDAALKRTARFGDGWRALSYADVESLTYGYSQIHKYANDLGRTLPERFITDALAVVNIQDTEEEALSDYKKAYSKRILPSGIYRSQGNLSTEEYASEGALGPAEVCAQRLLEKLQVPGLARIVLYLQGTNPLQLLERFHKEVYPLVRDALAKA